ncbi:MAG: PilC/PilY family type IV pilus protein [Telluria sp.]
MKKILGFLMLLLLGGTAYAAVTSIAQLPLLNITGTGNVKPNLMLLYDNSGSMASAFTPDYVDDTSTCRAVATMSTTRACSAGQPPFNSSDFNRQYYDPKVTYTPPVKSDGTSYASMTSANTSKWTVVTTDGFGVNSKDLLGANASSTNLAGAFPDLKWCDTNKANCVYNAATYTYPNDSRYTSVAFYGNPYYYTINVAEYCTDDTLTKCTVTAVGAAAPAGYPKPAKVRWCDSTGLSNCQAKYSTTFKYPRFSNPNGGVVAAYGTITIKASATAYSIPISSVTVGEPGGPVVITNGAVTATNGTSSATNQAIVATSLAASIIAKTGLTNQYLACVKAPNPSNSTVPACSTYGISLGANNIVAVVPIDCLPSAPSKAVGICSVVPDGSRTGWTLSVSAPQTPVQITNPATALIKVSGTASSGVTLNGGTSMGGAQIISANTTIKKNDTASTIAAAIAAAINTKSGTNGTIKAYVGPNNVSTACAGQTSTVVCVVDTSATAGGATVSMGSLSVNNSGVSFTTTAASTPTVLNDAIPTDTAPLGAGAAVFVRTDIVPGYSYPKAASRSDCAGSSCSYDEEMTNFANWYAYYKTRNQMMKTAVGQAFQPLNSNYNVGIVSLETAAAEGTITPPGVFSGTTRSGWYDALYAMNGSQSTPLRPALNAVGKMYGNQSPYVAASGKEVVQYPCQQNFTFLTTDGYWNGGAAQIPGMVKDSRTGKMVPGLVDLPSNDEKEDTTRFCTRGSGCVDSTAQTSNTLADVALYWYNGGSGTTVSSLRTSLEDWNRPGLVPAADGENTRLHMNTYTLGLGVDGIMNYEEKYETPKPGGDFYNLVTGVATGCPWNNNGRYVWPDVILSNTTGGATVQARVDDLWHAAINGHGKYFSASDPTQVVAGLSSALANIKVRVGAAAAAATSTPNISQQDNDIFSDTFTTVKWYGELTDRKLDPVTGNVGTTTVWNSSNMVGRKVTDASDSRVLLMYDALNTATHLKEFRYEASGAFPGMTAVEKAWFDNKCAALTQCATLSTGDRATVNAGKNIVDWLRGQQQYADGTIMRAYGRTKDNAPGLNTTLPIVLGDIASSKPAYLREPRKGYPASDYATFKADQTAKRAATVFVAANDGMLHAFTAATGEEIWAYAPRITMKKLYLQASTTYGTNHQFTTDGSPEVADVKLSTGWGTVLVAGLNAGGRGYYALDVTNPASPKALWELCADPTVCSGINYDADIGLSFGNPQFGTWKDAAGVEHWVVFLTAGYNNVPGSDNINSGTGKGYLYVVDAETGRVLDKTSTGAGDTSTPSGFARITAVSLNPATDPKITYVYGGDNLGKMWRFDYTSPGSPAVVQMGDAGVKQPVTSRPEVTMCRVNTSTSSASSVVIYGTGRLLDLGDIANTDIQSVYVLKDTGSAITPTQWRNAANMSKQNLAKTASGTGYTYTIGGAAIDLSTQAGWFFDLDQNTGERVNLDPKVVAGTLNVVSNMPTSSTDCSVGGSSNLYQLDVCTGEQVVIDSTLGEMAGHTLSTNAAAVGFIIVRLPNGTLKLVATTADGGTVSERLPPATSDDARRAGWRRVRE